MCTIAISFAAPKMFRVKRRKLAFVSTEIVVDDDDACKTALAFCSHAKPITFFEKAIDGFAAVSTCYFEEL